MAIHWYGRYSREEFSELDGAEQSRIIALWLISQQVEGIIAKEHMKELKKAQSR